MKKLIPPIACLTITVLILLVMYNNLNNGTLILTVPLLINLFVIVIPWRHSQRLSMVSRARPVSVCLVCALGTILAIEAAFPILLPKEYAQIRDVTKNPSGPLSRETPAGVLVFSNEDQNTPRDLAPAPAPPDSQRSWHVPNQTFVYYGYEPNQRTAYVNKFRWNSQGYFDHDYPFQKPHGMERCLVIGDSYVEAIQVPLNKTFHKMLEASMNQGHGGTNGKRVEVIALGNSGTGQVQHFKVLQSQGFNYSPDMVVMSLCSNDFCDDDTELKAELVLASGEVSPLVKGLTKHGYYALGFAVRRSEELRRNRIAISPELLQWSQAQTPRIEAAWGRTLNQIRASRDLCRQRGVLFLLVYLGSDLEVKYFLDPDGTISRLKAMGGAHGDVQWDLTKSINRVRSYCEAHDIPMVSLLDPLIAAQKETGKLVFWDHYSMFGHEVAASVLNCAVRLLQSGAYSGSFQPCTEGESWKHTPRDAPE